MKLRTTNTLIAALFVAALPIAASAGCNPACADGEVCRYEAAGGYFYCAPAPSSVIGGFKPRTAGGTLGAGGSFSSTATGVVPAGRGVAPGNATQPKRRSVAEPRR